VACRGPGDAEVALEADDSTGVHDVVPTREPAKGNNQVIASGATNEVSDSLDNN